MSQYFNVLKYFFGLIMDYANILFSLLKTLFEEQSTQNHIFLVSLFYNSKCHDHFFDFGSKVISPNLNSVSIGYECAHCRHQKT